MAALFVVGADFMRSSRMPRRIALVPYLRDVARRRAGARRELAPRGQKWNRVKLPQTLATINANAKGALRGGARRRSR